MDIMIEYMCDIGVAIAFMMPVISMFVVIVESVTI